MSLYKKLFKAISSGGISAAASYLSILLVVRYAGAGVYADYIVDLSVLSVVAILMEVVPAYYIVYKVQEDPAYYKLYATFIWMTIPVCIGLVLLLNVYFSILKSFTLWMILYLIGLNIKRYFDVYYQSTGNVQKLYIQESLVNIVRVLLLFSLFTFNIKLGSDMVWATLGGAQLVIYSCFLLQKDIRSDFFSLGFKGFSEIFPERKADLLGYYITSGAKKMRDNILPLVTGYYVHDKEVLGIFFFAYRSYAAVAGLLRTVEAFLVHKENFNFIRKQSGLSILLFSLLGSVGYISLILFSNLFFKIKVEWSSALVFSLCFIPYTYSILARAAAYNQYQTKVIIISFLAYVLVICLGVTAVVKLMSQYALGFSIVILFAETIALLIMRSKKNA